MMNLNGPSTNKYNILGAYVKDQYNLYAIQHSNTVAATNVYQLEHITYADGSNTASYT